MKLDVRSLQRLLCDRLCVDVGVEERADDTVMLRTHFRFPDGDSYPIHLSATPSEALRLSDRGHTLMHISYEHDVDSFVEGSRGLSHFHRHELRFESLLVFADQASIPRLDLARLSDVGGDMISSLASYESFSRKLLQRVT